MSGSVAFLDGGEHSSGPNNVMPRLLLTLPNGKQHSANLVAASASQQPNEIQKRELDQINKRLPSQILEEMSARGLNILPREYGLLLSRLKTTADLSITIGD
jgi:hypothetical protein